MESNELGFLLDELQKLRDRYIFATPRQRLKVANQRIKNPDAGANILVTTFSAVEAFARSLVLHSKKRPQINVRKLYARYKDRTASTLIAEYLKIIDKDPIALFGKDLWKTFKLAESYRNLLVHECTYLESIKFGPLTNSCNEVLKSLITIAKTNNHTHL